MEEKKKALLKVGASPKDESSFQEQVYHTKREPMTLKELEKEGGKAGKKKYFVYCFRNKFAGLHDKQVKEINVGLLDDNLVMQDKIGQANVYWSFPAAQGAELRGAVVAAEKRLEEAKKKLKVAQDTEAKARIGREDVDGTRAAKLKEYQEWLAKREALAKEYEKYKENDPEELERILKEAAEFKEHAIRWTENLCVHLPTRFTRLTKISGQTHPFSIVGTPSSSGS